MEDKMMVKIMTYIRGSIAAIGLLMMIGTAGGMDRGTIGLLNGSITMLIGLAAFVWGSRPWWWDGIVRADEEGGDESEHDAA
jgi:hypothetical protein